MKKKNENNGKKINKKISEKTRKKGRQTPTSSCTCARPRENLLRVTSFPVKTPEKRAGNPNFRLSYRSCAMTHLYYSSSTKCTACACARDHFRDFRSGPLPVMLLPVAHAHAITSGSFTTTNVT